MFFCPKNKCENCRLQAFWEGSFKFTIDTMVSATKSLLFANQNVSCWWHKALLLSFFALLNSSFFTSSMSRRKIDSIQRCLCSMWELSICFRGIINHWTLWQHWYLELPSNPFELSLSSNAEDSLEASPRNSSFWRCSHHKNKRNSHANSFLHCVGCQKCSLICTQHSQNETNSTKSLWLEHWNKPKTGRFKNPVHERSSFSDCKILLYEMTTITVKASSRWFSPDFSRT